MHKITEEDLFRLFNGNSTGEEIQAINSWLESDGANRKKYREAHDLFEAMLLEDAEATAIRPAAARSGRRVRIVRLAVAIVANAAVLAGIFFISRNISERNAMNRLAGNMTTIEVPDGQRMDITLGDGTRIKLNSGAVLQYPSIFREDSREVRLDGDAFFDVTHDEARPFTVHTFASDVRVLGTRFNINSDESERYFTAVLIDGAVKVTSASDANESIVMKPSDMVSYENGHLVYKGHYSKSEVIWTEGLIDLEGLSFDKLVKKLERAYGVDIVLQTESFPAMENVSGEIRISDGIDHAMRVLQHIADFQYIKDPVNGTIYIR